eukprot:364717-Chlamydomonas_euryale.AAC.3
MVVTHLTYGCQTWSLAAFYPWSRPGFQRRQGGIIMSFWDNVHAHFDEDCFHSNASPVFSDANTAFAVIRKYFPLDMHSV